MDRDSTVAEVHGAVGVDGTVEQGQNRGQRFIAEGGQAYGGGDKHVSQACFIVCIIL